MTAIAVPHKGRPRLRAAPKPLEERYADWVFETLVNRTSRYGRYCRRGTGVSPSTSWEGLTREVVIRHFHGRIAPDDIIGVHASSEDETCRWVAGDFDVHEPKNGERADDPALVARSALRAAHKAAQAGFRVILEDSNGRGGAHVWLLLAGPVPQGLAWRLGRWLVDAWEADGLLKRPESFPKSRQLSGMRCGNWLRLPGRHHKREHWSKFRFQLHKAPGTLMPSWLPWEAGVRMLPSMRPMAVDIERVLGDFDPEPHRRPAKFDPRGYDPGDETDPEFVRTRDRLMSALRWIRRAAPELADGYDFWIEIGQALTGLGDAGLRLWHFFSQGSHKYDPGELDLKWETFQRPADGAAGLRSVGTVFHNATRLGWTYGDQSLARAAYEKSKLAKKSSSTVKGGR